MPNPENTLEAKPADGLPLGDLTAVGSYPTAQEGLEHSLVVLAMGLDCWLLPGEQGHQLLVARVTATTVRTELVRYDLESIRWPPEIVRDTSARTQLDLVAPLIWALVVLGVYRAQLRYPTLTDDGALDSIAVIGKGEWWRGFTALFLHADGSHLVSNLGAGLFLFAAALTVFGRLYGWLLIALAAVAANLVDAAVHYPDAYRSIGASTAVFAALGLLTGRATRIATNTGHPHRMRSLFLPLAAGLTVLALYGGGGVGIDVLAHVTGFGMGVVLGFLRGRASEVAAP